VTVLQAAVPAVASGGALLGVVGALVALRFLMGALASPTYPASLEGVSRWTTPNAQGRANGLVIGSVGLGSAIAPPFITAVMLPWGWRVAMVASAIPAALIAVAWLMVKVPARRDVLPRSTARDSHPSESHGRVVARLLRTPGFALLTLSYTLQGYVGYIFIFWFYLYLVQVRHFSLVEGAWVASLPWVLSAVSIPLGGLISDRLVQGRMGPVWGRRLIPIAGMGGAGIFISIGAHTTEAWLAAFALAVATALVLSVESPFWTTVAGLAGDRTGTGGGIMNTGCNIGGFVSPMLTPMLGEMFGWEPALHVAAGLSVIAALAWFWITPPRATASGSP
jgi:ACS family glucarate transporter-like MFS transporter